MAEEKVAAKPKSARGRAKKPPAPAPAAPEPGAEQVALQKYKEKRHFGKTAEPAGGMIAPQQVGEVRRFCVQKHDAC
jgi:hypothetical protein